MNILVIGANGQIGRILCRRLVEAGDHVRALLRHQEQFPALRACGAEPVGGDLEDTFEDALEGCDAVVFTAGSGGKTGGDKTLLVDLWGAVRAMRACETRGVRRFVMVSALRAHDPDTGPAAIRHYLVAKHVADEYLMRSGLDYTILRPGRLLDEPGTGRVTLTLSGPREVADIPRADVAHVVQACLKANETVGGCYDLVSGDTPIEKAVGEPRT